MLTHSRILNQYICAYIFTFFTLHNMMCYRDFIFLTEEFRINSQRNALHRLRPMKKKSVPVGMVALPETVPGLEW